MNVGHRGILCN